jgi:hypothetical protein
MSENHCFILTFALSVLLVFGSSLSYAWRNRSKEKRPSPTLFNETFSGSSWVRKLNFGAFVFSPLWLFLNGFWLSGILHMVAWYFFPLLGLLISIVLFFKGSSWSWGSGERWGNDSEAFLDEQMFWSILAWILVSSFLIIILLVRLISA